MARLDYKVSVTPVEQTATGVDAGPVQTETISYSFQKTLGGGNSSLNWGGADSTEWNAGVNTYLSSEDGVIVASTSSCDGIFIKHTGVDFSDGTTTNDVTVNIHVDLAATGEDHIFCKLKSGEAVMIPRPADGLKFYMTDAGTNARVEYAVFV